MCIAALAALPAMLGTTTAAAGAAGAVSSGMTAMQMFSLGSTILSAGMSAYGAYNQTKVANAVAENNAKLADYAARDAQRRGEKEAADILKRGAEIKGTQQAVMAAKGLDLGYGTAADVQNQTTFFAQSDAITAQNNAAREAWNYRAQKASYQSEANKSPWVSAAGSLLGGAGAVANRWNMYKGK